jgi:hypothetical protein
MVGGSGGKEGFGAAIHLQEAFRSCSTGMSHTFGNTILSGQRDFKVKYLEIWGFSLFSEEDDE